MKVRQYFVIRGIYSLLVVSVLFGGGCSAPPPPEDSFVITIDDYNRVSVDTVQSAVIHPDSLPAIGVDTSLVYVAEVDSIVLPDSSLLASDSLLADTLEVPEDTLQVESPVDNWQIAHLEIQGSLYQSLGVVQGVDPDILGAHCVRHLVWEMNPWNGFIAGDSLTILYTTDPPDRENMVMAFSYVPVAGSSNTPFSGYVFTRTGDNWPSVWKPDGTELVKLLDRMPIRTFEEITSVYGEPRGDHSHAGVDYKAPEGTPVFSITGGSVLRTDWNTQYNGKCIEISFGSYSEVFLHLHSIDDAIYPGAVIEPGQQVGTVGNTGISTAPHLHYQINDPQGYSMDPYLYFSSHRRSLGQDDLELFQDHVERCRERMGIDG